MPVLKLVFSVEGPKVGDQPREELIDKKQIEIDFMDHALARLTPEAKKQYCLEILESVGIVLTKYIAQDKAVLSCLGIETLKRDFVAEVDEAFGEKGRA